MYETRNTVTMQCLIEMYDNFIKIVPNEIKKEILHVHFEHLNEELEALKSEDVYEADGRICLHNFLDEIESLGRTCSSIIAYCAGNEITDGWYHELLKLNEETGKYKGKISSMRYCFDMFFSEFLFSETIHGGEWPTDMIHAAAIVTKEAAEAAKEAFNFEYKFSGGKPKMKCLEDMSEELIKTGAMAARCLVAVHEEMIRVSEEMKNETS